MLAHIFKAKGGGFALYITSGPSLVGAAPVGLYANKADAKRAAKGANAKPWNF